VTVATVLLSSNQRQLLINYTGNIKGFTKGVNVCNAGGYVKWNGISQRPNVPAPRLTMNPHVIPYYKYGIVIKSVFFTIST